MATIIAVPRDVGRTGDGSTIQYTWTNVTEADDCASITFPEASDKSIQAAGDFGGASVALHGSNDKTNFAPLRIPAGTAIAITTAGINAVLENTVQVKPVITGGSSQNLTITLLCHLTNPMRT